MSEIKRGDLVMVVKLCCEKQADLARPFGIPWKVVEIDALSSVRCRFCGYVANPCIFVFSDTQFGRDCSGAPVQWLRKIDPPATGEYDRVPVCKTKEVTV